MYVRACLHASASEMKTTREQTIIKPCRGSINQPRKKNSACRGHMTSGMFDPCRGGGGSYLKPPPPRLQPRSCRREREPQMQGSPNETNKIILRPHQPDKCTTEQRSCPNVSRDHTHRIAWTSPSLSSTKSAQLVLKVFDVKTSPSDSALCTSRMPTLIFSS